MPLVTADLSEQEFQELQAKTAQMGVGHLGDVIKAALAAYTPQATGDVARLAPVQTQPGSASVQAPSGAAGVGTQPIGHSTNAASEMNPAGVTTPAAPPMAQGMGEAARPAVAPVPPVTSTAHAASGTSPAQTGNEPQVTSGVSTPNAPAARTALTPEAAGEQRHEDVEEKPRD